MSQLYPHIFASEKNGRTMVGACVAGDLHEIGMRMVCDFFEMEGWDTMNLGANTPTDDLMKLLAERKPDVLGVSATVPYHVAPVRQLIEKVRATPACAGVVILVGGYAFKVVPGLWRAVGADGTSDSAGGAIALALELMEAGQTR
jgi:methanogenic corrinoid protein MtbC1